MEQRYFDELKKAVAHSTLLSYPEFNKSFDIHTYSSGYQIGAMFIQEGKPIALYICKLTWLQTRYMVTENEFISKAKTFNEFCTILLGQPLKYSPTIRI